MGGGVLKLELQVRSVCPRADVTLTTEKPIPSTKQMCFIWLFLLTHPVCIACEDSIKRQQRTDRRPNALLWTAVEHNSQQHQSTWRRRTPQDCFCFEKCASWHRPVFSEQGLVLIICRICWCLSLHRAEPGWKVQCLAAHKTLARWQCQSFHWSAALIETETSYFPWAKLSTDMLQLILMTLVTWLSFSTIVRFKSVLLGEMTQKLLHIFLTLYKNSPVCTVN